MASKKKKMHDRIGNLPGHIVDHILSRLSLRDAVRTSTLSKNWRFKWVTLPSLVFDHKSILVDELKEKHRERKVVSIVDRVLLLHTGHIHKFEFRPLPLTVTAVSDIASWILYLSRSSVEKLILDVGGLEGEWYQVPSSMYSCQNLTYLELRECILELPREFKGFKSLKCLHLQCFNMEQLELELMISSCPLLEELNVEPSDDNYFTLLNIHAPNLTFFYICNANYDINFIDTFNLVDVSISFDSSGWDESKIGSGNIINFFNGLPNIQRFLMRACFLKYLANGTIPEKLPTPCLDLTFLSMDINFKNTKEYMAVLCLLRSSPNLKKLHLYLLAGQRDTIVDNINFENFERFPLNQLRFVEINGISSSRQELNFIKLVVENAPVLERMSVKPRSKKSGWDLVKELLRFRRASTSAEIIYCGADLA